MKLLTLPHEHGGYLTVAGAAAAGAALSPSPLLALGVGVAVAAGFFARGPIEAARPARLDGALLSLCTAAALLGSVLSARWWTLFLPLGIVASSLWARRGRRQRQMRFELAGMAALGATAGACASAGGARPELALVAALVVGAHAALSVPLVRTELRPRERPLGRRAERLVAASLVLCMLAVVALGPRAAVLALVPRLLHLGMRRAGALTGWRPSLVGLRETVELGTAVGLLILGVR